MPLVVANTLQVTIEGHTADGPFANVFHVDNSGGPSDHDLATAVMSAYGVNLLPVMCNSIEVTRFRWVDLSSSSGAVGQEAAPGGGVSIGGVGAQALPPNNAWLVAWGGANERGIRTGRSYLPGVRADEVDERGDISSTQRATYQAAVDDFLSAVLSEAGGPLLTVHNPASGSPTTTEITGGVVETPVATQRRRLKR